jgi:GT2 family glycosyltransferase
MTSSPRKAAVIVVTWNARKWLDGCFGSLEKAEWGDLQPEVICVDNASTDGTADEIDGRWPWVRLLRQSSNLGFAGGNNVGIKAALDSGAEFVYLLNQDTEVSPNFLLEAVAAVDFDTKIGSAQSLLLLHPERDLVNSVGNAIHFLGFGYCLGYRESREALVLPAPFPEVAYASGAGVILRAEALRQVGPFDVALFLYHEDLDLGWRLRLAGWKNILVPKSVVWHKYQFSRSVSKLYWMERNRLIVLLKNLRAWSLVVILPWFFVSDLALFVMSVRAGWWRQKLKAWGWFWRPSSWAYIFRERRRVQRLRRVGDREIIRLFVSRISHQEADSAFVRKVANPLMAALWAVLRLLIV